MNASAGRSTPAAKRWPRFRFSLRVLLLAFTAAAIGFPIWYRWPYTEESQLPADTSKPPAFHVVTTWRRTWGGGRTKHGPETRERRDGKVSVVEHYKEGVLDGPFTEHYHGTEIAGQYTAGQKSGRWKRRSTESDLELFTTWNEGKLDGPAEMQRLDGTSIPFLFRNGSLIELDGKPVHYSFVELKNRVRADSEQLAAILERPAIIEFIETPLKDSLAFLTDIHDIPGAGLRVAPSRVNADQPVTANLSDLDLLSALAIIGALNNLGWDYRYGCLWITDDAAEWTDPTGVLSIQPRAGTLLADFWNEPINVNTFRPTNVSQPLATVLKSMPTPLDVDFDTSQIDPTENEPDRYSIVFHINQRPFHQTLGILLYETGCRCELAGDKLVILPPENVSDRRE
jgi:hypothetical protein